MAIEEEFSIEIPDKDADAIHSGESLMSFSHLHLVPPHLSRRRKKGLMLTYGPTRSGQGRRVHSFSTRCTLNPDLRTGARNVGREREIVYYTSPRESVREQIQGKDDNHKGVSHYTCYVPFVNNSAPGSRRGRGGRAARRVGIVSRTAWMFSA